MCDHHTNASATAANTAPPTRFHFEFPPSPAGGAAPAPAAPAAAAAKPAHTAPPDVSVPLSHPRYEKKTRLNRAMHVTDGTGATGDIRDTGAILGERSVEALRVRQGPVRHEESIAYHTFALFKHGKSQIHAQSVGYSSDGDLVLTKREVGRVVPTARGTDATVRRVAVAVDGAVCLNPKARPRSPVTDGELDAKWQRRMNKLKKYPGVKCPKSHKSRNRLANDHFATAEGRKLYASAAEDSDGDGRHASREPVFGPLPSVLHDALLNGDKTERTRAMLPKKIGPEATKYLLGEVDVGRYGSAYGPGGVSPPAGAALPPPALESASFRFAQLPNKMKGELIHALSSTEFMPGFVDDLEAKFTALLRNAHRHDAAKRAAAGNAEAQRAIEADAPPMSLELALKDGYCRLVCHGVASFYKLKSGSANNDQGTRVTLVEIPKRVPLLPEQSLASHLRGERPPQSPVSPLGGNSSRDSATTSGNKRSTIGSAKTPQPRATNASLVVSDLDDDGNATLGAERRKKFKKRVLLASSTLRMRTMVET